MAGIFGIYAPPGAPGHAKAMAGFETMASCFAEPAWNVTIASAHGLKIGVASYPNEGKIEPMIERGDCVLASAGSILLANDEVVSHLARGELNGRLIAQAEPEPTALFEKKTEGRFAIVLLEPKKRLLHLGADRFALYPFYYHERDGVVWFSTRLAAIARANREHLTPDEESIADFLAHKHFIGTWTYFKEVSMVPEGGYVTFGNGAPRVTRYWQYRFEENLDQCWGKKEAVTHLRTAWNRAMDAAAKAGPRDGVPLSGGLDSRALLAALARRGKHVTAYTFGDPNCNDILFARRVTEKYRLPHVTTTLEQASFIYRDWETIIRRSDGCLPLTHAHPFSLTPFLAGSCDSVFDGLTGEVLGSVGLVRHPHTMVTGETAPDLLRKVFMLFGDDVLLKVMPGATPARERIRRYGHYYSDFGGHKHGTSVINIFSNTSRQRRFVANQPRLLEGEKRVFCPFWTIEYARVCHRLHPVDRRTMRPWIVLNRREFPELIHIPWTRTRLPIWFQVNMAESFREVHETASYVNYFMGKFTGIRPLGSYQAGFAFYFDWLRDNPPLKAFVEEVLYDPSIARFSFLSADGVRDAVSKHMGNILVNNTDLIGSLLSCVLYLKGLGY
ncbi:MAG: hypothetical protein FJ109_11185 [Deltaproteobacteria bacterium]|nr:hypothetical protein [Deltaproteobacteria bacterium]